MGIQDLDVGKDPRNLTFCWIQYNTLLKAEVETVQNYFPSCLAKGTVSGSGTGPLDYGATGPVPDP